MYNHERFCVYILQCNDDSYYTGMTSNIGQRLLEHETGKFPDCYTFDKRLFKLVFYQIFQDFNQAMLFEKKIKGWSRRKKQALIEERWGDLPKLSKNYTEFGRPEDLSPSR
ncbi:MAG: GIY-YIG nuclease family protein [Moheibacter sp.]